jgi:glycosyltransferase involved in cell wall biosynthesis
MPPDVAASVIVPTYNRARHLDRCLPTLLAQRVSAAYEIVVVDDGSVDDTAQVVTRWSARSNGLLRYIPIVHGGLNKARNTGLQAARGELACLLDDDVRAPEQWLAAVLDAASRHPDAAAIGGPIHLVFDGRAPRTCGREPWSETNQDLGPDECRPESLYGSNLTITQTGRRLGGSFDESIPSSGDEEEYLARIRTSGGYLLYVPSAGVDHVRQDEELRLRWLARKRFQRGRDQVTFLAMEGEQIDAKNELAHAIRCAAHAARHRCSMGLLDSAFSLGRLMGHRRHRPQ